MKTQGVKILDQIVAFNIKGLYIFGSKWWVKIFLLFVRYIFLTGIIDFESLDKLLLPFKFLFFSNLSNIIILILYVTFLVLYIIMVFTEGVCKFT